MNKFLKICIWNANGLSNHNQELQAFVNLHKLDIVLISETHFTNISFFKIPNYICYSTNHPDNTAHGGSAVLIRNNLKHHEVPNYQFDFIQATNVVVEDRSGPITLSAVYIPPRHIVNNQQFTDFFHSLGNRFLAGGDYNAKSPAWGSRLTNPRGRQLLMSINNNNLQPFSTGEPTYWPSDISKIPDLLDFFITKGISPNYVHVESSLDLSSDHTPVIVTISPSVILKERPLTLCNKHTDWNLFRHIVNTNLTLKMSLKSTEDIDITVENFNSCIQKACFQSTPVITNQSEYYVNFPNEIKKKIAEKRRLRRIWQLSRNPIDKTNLNRASQELKRLIYNTKNEWFNEYTSQLSPTEATNYSLWKASRGFKRPKIPVPPIMKPNATWAKNNKEKANVFAQHLCSVFKPNDDRQNQYEEEIESILNAPNQLSLPPRSFTPSETKEVIFKEIKSFKAPGYDLVNGKILKELPKKAYIYLTALFNAILRTGHFPSQWKVSEVVMLLKPGKPAHQVSSYRPISLLPTVSKVFEKLFLKRFYPEINHINLIPYHQFGFRRQHSTIEQVHRVANWIKEDLETKKYCSAAFLDVSQAFDKVWLTGLLFKLKTKISHSFYDIIKSFLTNRFFRVKFEDTYSELYKIEAGVPQGSVLSPILYTLYTADIPTHPEVLMATFADDTALLASHEDPVRASEILQENLNNLANWFSDWKIKINETKSAHITFTTKSSTCPQVTLNNVIIPQANEVKYLGMYLDRRLTWKNHIWHKRLVLNNKFRQMSWLIGKNSGLQTTNKLLLYKTILKPIWTYGIQLWGTASVSNIEIIQRFQSKALRSILQAPWFVNNGVLHTDTKVPYVKDEIARFSSKYQEKLNIHPNHLAMNLLDNSVATFRLKRNNFLDLPNRFV